MKLSPSDERHFWQGVVVIIFVFAVGGFIFGTPLYFMLRHQDDIYQKAIYKNGDLVERKIDGKNGQILAIQCMQDTVSYSVRYAGFSSPVDTYEFELKLGAEK